MRAFCGLSSSSLSGLLKVLCRKEFASLAEQTTVGCLELLGEDERVGDPCSFLPPPSVPLCPAQHHELLPQNVAELSKWLLFVFTSHLVLLFEASKFLLQFVDLGGSAVHCVVGLNVSTLDVAKPPSCIVDYDRYHSIEPPVHLPLGCGFQDLAHVSVKL